MKRFTAADRVLVRQLAVQYGEIKGMADDLRARGTAAQVLNVFDRALAQLLDQLAMRLGVADD